MTLMKQFHLPEAPPSMGAGHMGTFATRDKGKCRRTREERTSVRDGFLLTGLYMGLMIFSFFFFPPESCLSILVTLRLKSINNSQQGTPFFAPGATWIFSWRYILFKSLKLQESL